MGSGSSKYNVSTVQRSATGGGSEGAGGGSGSRDVTTTKKSHKKSSDASSPVQLKRTSAVLHPSGPHALDFDTAVVGGDDDDDDQGISDLDTRSGGGSSGFVARGDLDVAGFVKGGNNNNSSSVVLTSGGDGKKHGVNGVQAAKVASPGIGDRNDGDVLTVGKSDHSQSAVNTIKGGAGNVAVAGSGATSARFRGTGAAASINSNLTEGASLEKSGNTVDVKLKATTNDGSDLKAAKSGVKSVDAGGLSSVKSVEAGGFGKVTDGAKSSVDDDWAHVLAKAETLGKNKNKKVSKEKEAKKEKKEKERLAKEQKKREKEEQKLKEKEKKKAKDTKKDKGSKEKGGKKAVNVEKSKQKVVDKTQGVRVESEHAGSALHGQVQAEVIVPRVGKDSKVPVTSKGAVSGPTGRQPPAGKTIKNVEKTAADKASDEVHGNPFEEEADVSDKDAEGHTVHAEKHSLAESIVNAGAVGGGLALKIAPNVDAEGKTSTSTEVLSENDVSLSEAKLPEPEEEDTVVSEYLDIKLPIKSARGTGVTVSVVEKVLDGSEASKGSASDVYLTCDESSEEEDIDDIVGKIGVEPTAQTDVQVKSETPIHLVDNALNTEVVKSGAVNGNKTPSAEDELGHDRPIVKGGSKGSDSDLSSMFDSQDNIKATEANRNDPRFIDDSAIYDFVVGEEDIKEVSAATVNARIQEDGEPSFKSYEEEFGKLASTDFTFKLTKSGADDDGWGHVLAAAARLDDNVSQSRDSDSESYTSSVESVPLVQNEYEKEFSNLASTDFESSAHTGKSEDATTPDDTSSSDREFKISSSFDSVHGIVKNEQATLDENFNLTKTSDKEDVVKADHVSQKDNVPVSDAKNKQLVKDTGKSDDDISSSAAASKIPVTPLVLPVDKKETESSLGKTIKGTVTASQKLKTDVPDFTTTTVEISEVPSKVFHPGTRKSIDTDLSAEDILSITAMAAGKGDGKKDKGKKKDTGIKETEKQKSASALQVKQTAEKDAKKDKKGKDTRKSVQVIEVEEASTKSSKDEKKEKEMGKRKAPEPVGIEHALVQDVKVDDRKKKKDKKDKKAEKEAKLKEKQDKKAEKEKKKKLKDNKDNKKDNTQTQAATEVASIAVLEGASADTNKEKVDKKKKEQDEKLKKEKEQQHRKEENDRKKKEKEDKQRKEKEDKEKKEKEKRNSKAAEKSVAVIVAAPDVPSVANAEASTISTQNEGNAPQHVPLSSKEKTSSASAASDKKGVVISTKETVISKNTEVVTKTTPSSTMGAKRSASKGKADIVPEYFGHDTSVPIISGRESYVGASSVVKNVPDNHEFDKVRTFVTTAPLSEDLRAKQGTANGGRLQRPLSQPPPPPTAKAQDIAEQIKVKHASASVLPTTGDVEINPALITKAKTPEIKRRAPAPKAPDQKQPEKSTTEVIAATHPKYGVQMRAKKSHEEIGIDVNENVVPKVSTAVEAESKLAPNVEQKTPGPLNTNKLVVSTTPTVEHIDHPGQKVERTSLKVKAEVQPTKKGVISDQKAQNKRSSLDEVSFGRSKDNIKHDSKKAEKGGKRSSGFFGLFSKRKSDPIGDGVNEKKSEKSKKDKHKSLDVAEVSSSKTSMTKDKTEKRGKHDDKRVSAAALVAEAQEKRRESKKIQSSSTEDAHLRKDKPDPVQQGYVKDSELETIDIQTGTSSVGRSKSKPPKEKPPRKTGPPPDKPTFQVDGEENIIVKGTKTDKSHAMVAPTVEHSLDTSHDDDDDIVYSTNVSGKIIPVDKTVDDNTTSRQQTVDPIVNTHSKIEIKVSTEGKDDTDQHQKTSAPSQSKSIIDEILETKVKGKAEVPWKKLTLDADNNNLQHSSLRSSLQGSPQPPPRRTNRSSLSPRARPESPACSDTGSASPRPLSRDSSFQSSRPNSPLGSEIDSTEILRSSELKSRLKPSVVIGQVSTKGIFAKPSESGRYSVDFTNEHGTKPRWNIERELPQEPMLLESVSEVESEQRQTVTNVTENVQAKYQPVESVKEEIIVSLGEARQPKDSSVSLASPESVTVETKTSAKNVTKKRQSTKVTSGNTTTTVMETTGIEMRSPGKNTKKKGAKDRNTIQGPEVYTVDTGHPGHQLDTSDLNPTTYNSMPRHRKSVDLNRPLPPTSGSGSGYMPGMSDGGGKKKGIFSIFSRKKGGKFSPEVAYSDYEQTAPSSHSGKTRSNVTSVTQVTHSSTLPRQEPPRGQSQGALPRQQLQHQQQHPQYQQQEQQHPQYQQPPPQQLPQQRSQPHPPPQQVNIARSVSSEESQTQQGLPNNSVQAHKPSRKKRQAPLPPGIPKATPIIEATAPVTVAVEKSQSMNALSHSRTSSHSSGFDESNVSPLESPGNTARGDTVKRISVNDSSLERTKDLPSGRQSPPQASAGGVSSLTKKKKKSAPPPPPAPTASTPEVSAPQPSTPNDQSPIEATTADIVISASPHPPPPPETPDELRVAMVTELKQEMTQENSTAEVTEYTKKIQTLSTSIDYDDAPDVPISPPPAFTTSVMEKYETEMEEKEARRAVDSDASSDASSVVAYDINDDADDVVEDEVALPRTDDSVLLLHSHSLEEQRPAVTVIQVGRSESPPPDSGHASISPVKTDSEYNDSRRELAYNEEISFNNAEVEYVTPSVSKEEEEDSSDDEEQFAVNDYRIRNLVKEEVIDFGFRQRELDPATKKKKEQSPEAPPLVMSLRHAMKKVPVTRSVEESYDLGYSTLDTTPTLPEPAAQSTFVYEEPPVRKTKVIKPDDSLRSFTSFDDNEDDDEDVIDAAEKFDEPEKVKYYEPKVESPKVEVTNSSRTSIYSLIKKEEEHPVSPVEKNSFTYSYTPKVESIHDRNGEPYLPLPKPLQKQQPVYQEPKVVKVAQPTVLPPSPPIETFAHSYEEVDRRFETERQFEADGQFEVDRRFETDFEPQVEQSLEDANADTVHAFRRDRKKKSAAEYIKERKAAASQSSVSSDDPGSPPVSPVVEAQMSKTSPLEKYASVSYDEKYRSTSPDERYSTSALEEKYIPTPVREHRRAVSPVEPYVAPTKHRAISPVELYSPPAPQRKIISPVEPFVPPTEEEIEPYVKVEKVEELPQKHQPGFYAPPSPIYKPGIVPMRVEPPPYQDIKEIKEEDDVFKPVSKKPQRKTSNLLLGPRPWGVKSHSEANVPDVATALIMSRKHSEDHAKHRVSALSFSPHSEGEREEFLEEKSISMIAHPAERTATASKENSYYQEDISRSTSDLPWLNKPVSPSYPSTKDDNLSGVGGDVSTSSLQNQYEELQKQFSRWQHQLMENQALLARQNITPHEEERRLEELGHQMEMLKQSTVVVNKPAPAPVTGYRKVSAPTRSGASYVDSAALRAKSDAPTKSKQDRNSVSDTSSNGLAGRFSAGELLNAKARLRQGSTDISGVYENENNNNSYDTHNELPREGSPSAEVNRSSWSASSSTAPPPPPPAMQSSNISQRASWSSSNVTASASKAPPKGKSRFEPILDPREELMLAIRGAGGRSALRKVPVKQTRWHYNSSKAS